MKLRYELLHFPASDGGLEILDLAMEQTHRFSPDDAAALAAFQAGQGDELPDKLRTYLQQFLLLEGPAADALREGARQLRTRSKMPPPELDAADGAWALAADLPDFVAASWRDSERWRRLAEDRIGGRRILRLEGFLSCEAAADLATAAAALAFERQEAMYAHGDCCNISSELPDILSPFRSGPLNTLIGQVMGETMPERIFARVWRLGVGDHIAVHNDGLHYVTTFSIGLTPDWTARQGGSIVFGHPQAKGLEVVERWLPHLGDMLLFRPTATAWHAVEPVVEGTRWTLTGHYVAPSYPG